MLKSIEYDTSFMFGIQSQWTGEKKSMVMSSTIRRKREKEREQGKLKENKWITFRSFSMCYRTQAKLME